jgi:hypothetical protein
MSGHRDLRALAMNPGYRDFSGEWIGSLLVVNKMPRRPRPDGRAGTHAVWRCHDHDKRRDIFIRTAELKRLQREREAELEQHREHLERLARLAEAEER